MKNIALAVFCVVIASAPSRAQSPSPADTAAIQALVAGQGEAWNRGDAKAFGEHYAQDGTFTNIVGTRLFGREAFIQQHQMIFSTIYKGSHVSMTIARTKFVRPDVALVDVEAALSGFARLPPGMQAGSDGALHTQLLMVLTKEGANWSIAAFHNVAVVAVDGPPGSGPPTAGPPNAGPPTAGPPTAGTRQ